MQLAQAKIRYCPLCCHDVLLPHDNYVMCAECQALFAVRIPDKPPKPPQDPRRIRKECGSKVKHDTLESAVTHMQQIMSKPLPGRIFDTLNAYRCRYCASIHVGHLPLKGKVKEFWLARDLIPFPENHAVVVDGNCNCTD